MTETERMMARDAEVYRVLQLDGTLWLNLGDSYANDYKMGRPNWRKTRRGEALCAKGGKGLGRANLT